MSESPPPLTPQQLHAVLKKFGVWPSECCQDCIYFQPECAFRLTYAQTQKHTCASMLSQEKNPTTWWGFLSPLPGSPHPSSHSPHPRPDCSVTLLFFLFFSRCSCSPSVVTGGPSTLPLYFWTGRAACQEEQTDRRLWAAALCSRTADMKTVCKMTLLCLFTAGAPFGGGGRGWGRQAGWQGRKEKGFTTLKRVGIPPEPFPPFGWQLWKQLAGTHSHCMQMDFQLWVSFEISKWWRKWWAC